MTTTTAIIFIVGKAMIWLIIPLLFGIYEMRKHRHMLREEAEGRAVPTGNIPSWMQAPRASPPAAAPIPQTEAPAPVDVPEVRRAA